MHTYQCHYFLHSDIPLADQFAAKVRPFFRSLRRFRLYAECHQCRDEPANVRHDFRRPIIIIFACLDCNSSTTALIDTCTSPFRQIKNSCTRHCQRKGAFSLRTRQSAVVFSTSTIEPSNFFMIMMVYDGVSLRTEKESPAQHRVLVEGWRRRVIVHIPNRSTLIPGSISSIRLSISLL